MRLFEILNEVKVQSAWISDLIYNRPNKILTMCLSNGKAYSIHNITRTTFDKWKSAPSKGRFFHNRIKRIYNIKRIR